MRLVLLTGLLACVCLSAAATCPTYTCVKEAGETCEFSLDAMLECEGGSLICEQEKCVEAELLPLGGECDPKKPNKCYGSDLGVRCDDVKSICTKTLYPGDPCADHADCKSQNCTAGVCVGLGENVECEDWTDCEPMMRCHGSPKKKCKPLNMEGESCVLKDTCHPSTLCNKAADEKTCTEKYSLPDGADADDAQLCQSGYLNDEQKCSPAPQFKYTGEVCTVDANCTSDMRGVLGFCSCTTDFGGVENVQICQANVYAPSDIADQRALTDCLMRNKCPQNPYGDFYLSDCQCKHCYHQTEVIMTRAKADLSACYDMDFYKNFASIEASCPGYIPVPPAPSKKKMPAIDVILIIVAVVLGLGIVGLGLYCVCRPKRDNRALLSAEEEEGGDYQPPSEGLIVNDDDDSMI